MHEHIGCISNDLLYVFGKKWIDKEKLIDYAAKILKGISEKYGTYLFVDGTPIDLGRDISLIKAISEKSGVHIVASTGLYHYPSMYTVGHSESEIASWFIGEVEEGIGNTGIKPGILKAASTAGRITRDNEKRLTAMAIAQNETKLPVYVHSEHTKELAQMQLDIMLREIRNPEKIILGHAALNPDAEYLEKLLDKGCYICIDQCHCTNHSIESVGRSIALLSNKGYADKILISNDMCIYSDFGTRKNTGLELSISQQVERFGYIFTEVYESFIENGGSEKAWHKMFKENPVKILDV